MAAGWSATAVDPTNVAVLLNLLGASNPDLENLVRSIQDLTHARASMVGGDLHDTAAAVPPNVTVLIQPGLGLPLDLVGGLVQQLVNRIPGVTGGSTSEKVSLPSGDAIRLDYQVQPSGGGPLLGLRTYVLVNGGQTYLVTFTAAADQFSQAEPAFDSMIQSLQFGN